MEGINQQAVKDVFTSKDKPKTFADIQDAIIDPKGIFKYIQIDITNRETNEKKTVVRGYASCGFHADILSLFSL